MISADASKDIIRHTDDKNIEKQDLKSIQFEQEQYNYKNNPDLDIKISELKETIDNLNLDSKKIKELLLEIAYFGKQAIHNLHMVFKIKGIYESLSNSKLINADMERGNESIAFKTYFIEKYTIIVNVYTTDTVKVTFGCSENPFHKRNRLKFVVHVLSYNHVMV